MQEAAGGAHHRKLEKPEAIARLDAILDQDRRVMVARGISAWNIPPKSGDSERTSFGAPTQRRMPVIVATQMLNSIP